MINLLIAGYHGFGNCGDEAALLAMTSNIRKMADDVNITALSFDPEFTKTEYNINAVQRFNALQVLNAIRKSDIILSGGGTLLQDGTSTRSLIYYLSIIKAAKIMRKKVMLYANGIGPVKGKFNRKLIKAVVNTVDLITLREKLSERDLRALGVSRPNIFVTADPAFTLKPINHESAAALLHNENIPMDSGIIGVSVRNWHSTKLSMNDYITAVAQACDRFCEQGKNIMLIPMQFPKDTEILKKVKYAMKHKSYILQKAYAPDEILGIIGCTELMLSMRLHTLIFAGVMNVPMLGIIYDPKVDYYLKVLEMPSAVDVRTEAITSDELYDKMKFMLDNSEEQKAILEKNVSRLILKANENDKLLEKQLDIIRQNKKRREKR